MFIEGHQTFLWFLSAEGWFEKPVSVRGATNVLY